MINLKIFSFATAVPFPYSQLTRLMPLIPLYLAPRIVVIKFIFSDLLVHNLIANHVITKVKVIRIAGLHKL